MVAVRRKSRPVLEFAATQLAAPADGGHHQRVYARLRRAMAQSAAFAHPTIRGKISPLLAPRRLHIGLRPDHLADDAVPALPLLEHIDVLDRIVRHRVEAERPARRLE